MRNVTFQLKKFSSNSLLLFRLIPRLMFREKINNSLSSEDPSTVSRLNPPPPLTRRAKNLFSELNAPWNRSNFLFTRAS